ncbi:chromate transporter [Candidatus Roizmanbacteria bacterium CG_4_10_14_0_2_um_filter_36_35]|uniref:Chromate transporter n=4 Tax=Candidatus Roizmaniibacteriota TaxID=1752723 RepID=A0A2M7BVS9_9BACT|nr:MAG: chromate transporter [Candidatus Roizmanbacteria bacterium CG11_big_fil_rev_8_21_14_0_20_35_14]PIV10651.1 MAG: chromate transporter [Candidatus Roizmanbacteria bacterium CG03_land_8_20_14_0_80_35_26]PIZ67094.1 MAG: chromate transporter [Candidatus Roizmanbacteria bacterium CG_4_10_14_0_2_um_filter_36_35]PJC32710.1 MAG: chromate transporter [Candidatus Roizmanbacteria bacterium CG_4_9_14_0_2_um_filter_36_12]
MAKSDTKGTDFKSMMGKLENTLETYLVDKAPFQLPAGAKEVIVKYGPWITLILLILALPAILFTFGLGTLVAPFAFLGGMKAGVNFGIGMIFSAVVLVIEAIAIPGLFKRAVSSWRLMYYAALLGGVESLISFNLRGLIIGTGISLYILFQIKSYYK